MRRNNVFIQINYNSILLSFNKKIYNYVLEYSVDNYKIINTKLFYKEIENICKELNINNHFLSDNISIIIDNTYNESDKYIIKSIFKDLSFNKINFINVSHILNIKKDELIINIHEKYLKIYFNNIIICNKIYFKEHKKILDIYIPIFLENSIKNIKIFGEYPKIDDIYDYLSSKYNINIFIYSNNNIIPLSKIIC